MPAEKKCDIKLRDALAPEGWNCKTTSDGGNKRNTCVGLHGVSSTVGLHGVSKLSHGVTGRWKFFEMPKDPVTMGPEKHDCLFARELCFQGTRTEIYGYIDAHTQKRR